MRGKNQEPTGEVDQVAVEIAEAREAVRDPNAHESNEIVLACAVLISLLTATIEAAAHMHHVKGERNKALDTALGTYHDLLNQQENANITVYRHNQPDTEPEKGTIQGTHADTYGFEYAQLKHRELGHGVLGTADELLDEAEKNPRLKAQLRTVGAEAAAAMVSQEAQERAQDVHDAAGTKGVLHKAETTLGAVIGKITPHEGHPLAFLGKLAALGRTSILNVIPFGNMAFGFARKVTNDLEGSVANDRAYMDSVATQLLARRLKQDPQTLPQGNNSAIEQNLAGIGAAGPVVFAEGINLSDLGQALAIRIASRDWREMYSQDNADPNLRYIKAAFGICAAFDLSESQGRSTLKRAAAQTPAPVPVQ